MKLVSCGEGNRSAREGQGGLGAELTVDKNSLRSSAMPNSSWMISCQKNWLVVLLSI